MLLINHMGEKFQDLTLETIQKSVDEASQCEGRVIQLSRSEEDYVQVERTAEGFQVRRCEPKYGNRWKTKRVDLSDAEVMTIISAFIHQENLQKLIVWERWKLGRGCIMTVLLFAVICTSMWYTGRFLCQL